MNQLKHCDIMRAVAYYMSHNLYDRQIAIHNLKLKISYNDDYKTEKDKFIYEISYKTESNQFIVTSIKDNSTHTFNKITDACDFCL